MVPTGFTFTQVTTLREAKRLARENREGSQWFEKFIPSKDNVPGLNPFHKVRYRFNGKKWSHD